MPYSPPEPYDRGYLQRSGHSLYYEQSGNPDGVPAVVLHGGPGSGCRDAHRGWFDPRRFRSVLWDQRGAGRSRPLGSLADNDTSRLLADLEALREHLDIERWAVLGGSWGGTLALCYAAAYPSRVLGLVIRGVLAGRRRDRDWFFGPDGVARLFPQEYRRFVREVPEESAADPVAAYRELLEGADEGTRLRAAIAWLRWEDCVGRGGAPEDGQAPPPERAIARARIACHYAANGFFLDPARGALPPVGRLDRIPGAIVHGKRDLVYPLEQAVAVHERWPAAELKVVAGGGHLESEEGIAAAVTEAADRLRDRLCR